jgi:hypothetical protein
VISGAGGIDATLALLPHVSFYTRLHSAMSQYKKVAAAQASAEEQYKRTLARVAKIQGHLANAPRAERMKDKVCIVTGVGSLKGIGYVCT